MRKNERLIWSIYGEIEAVVARAMVAEGKMELMPRAMESLPDGHERNSRDMPILMVVAISGRHVGEYESRVSLLRA